MGGGAGITVDNVSKKFSSNLKSSLVYGLCDIAMDIAGIQGGQEALRKNEFWAVRDVSFELKSGDTIGIIGPNGSGKSTMLKMLNGIILPDIGHIRIKGKVGALIEVGAGFHPLLTGRENIYVNGSILGMSRAEIKRKFDSIVAFAEIGDFLDMPVKNYSSGMYVRLGFSVAAHMEPEILLVDEVLAVGDFSFQKKCFERLESITKQGTIIILISHSMSTIERFCPNSILFEHGNMLFHGDSKTAIAQYYQIFSNKAIGRLPVSSKIAHKDAGNMDVSLADFEVMDPGLKPTDKIVIGEPVRFVLQLNSKSGTSERLPKVAIRFLDFQTEELIANIQIPHDLIKNVGIDGRITLECDVPFFNLAPGAYQIEIKIGGDGEDLYNIALIRRPLEVRWSAEVVGSMSYKGKVFLPGQWKILERNLET